MPTPKYLEYFMKTVKKTKIEEKHTATTAYSYRHEWMHLLADETVDFVIILQWLVESMNPVNENKRKSYIGNLYTTHILEILDFTVLPLVKIESNFHPEENCQEVEWQAQVLADQWDLVLMARFRGKITLYRFPKYVYWCGKKIWQLELKRERKKPVSCCNKPCRVEYR